VGLIRGGGREGGRRAVRHGVSKEVLRWLQAAHRAQGVEWLGNSGPSDPLGSPQIPHEVQAWREREGGNLEGGGFEGLSEFNIGFLVHPGLQLETCFYVFQHMKRKLYTHQRLNAAIDIF
jgi:hypothetical protein